MRKSIVSNSIYNIVYKVINALYPLVAVTYISHILQAEKIGIVSYAQNIVSYFVVFSALGIPIYGVREIAKVADNRENRSDLFWELFFINCISTSLALVIYSILIFTVPRFNTNKALYIIAGIPVLLNYINVDWFFQGMEEYKFISIRNISVKVAALILLPVLIRSANDYLNYVLIYSLAIAGNNFLNIIQIRKYITRRTKILKMRQHFRAIAFLLVASLAVEIYVMIDTTLLGIFCDDSAVGCYSNAMKLTRTVNTMASAIGAVLLPRLSYIYDEGNKEEFNKLVNIGIKVMLVIAIPAAIGLVLLSEQCVLLLFGETFRMAIPTLRILAVMIPVVVLNTIIGAQVLITSNLENKYVISVVIGAIINIVLNILFIPRYGATSAAMTSLLSESVVFCFYLFFSRNVISIKISKSFLGSLLAPLAVYALIAILFLLNLNISDLLMLIVNIIVCLIIYFGLGIFLKNEGMVFGFIKLTELYRRSNRKN